MDIHLIVSLQSNYTCCNSKTSMICSKMGSGRNSAPQCKELPLAHVRMRGKKISAVRNFETGTQTFQHKKFKRLIQEFNKEYLAENTLKTQKKAIYNGKSPYNGHDNCKIVKRLFMINKCLELFSPQTTNFSILEMAEEVILNNLKPKSHFDFIR